MDGGQQRRVVEVRSAGKRGRRIVAFDDGAEVTVSWARIKDEGIAPGVAFDPSHIEQICRDDARTEAHEAALRMLAARPRAAQEVQQRLRQRGFDTETADREVRRLQMAGLLDDAQFAEAFVESRQRAGPRSARALAGELRAKGVDRGVAGDATAEVDDEAAAIALALARAARMTGLDGETRHRRLAGLLQRRGFSYGVIERALRQVLTE
jgi:regulatory protein